MFATISKRLALSATGLLLTTGLIVRSQSSEWRARLCDWMPPAGAEVGHVAESPVSPCVAAEGRIVAYPGAEVVVGTEVAGLIVRLTVEEKSAVRAGDLIAELNSADLRASRADRSRLSSASISASSSSNRLTVSADGAGRLAAASSGPDQSGNWAMARAASASAWSSRARAASTWASRSPWSRACLSAIASGSGSPGGSIRSSSACSDSSRAASSATRAGLLLLGGQPGQLGGQPGDRRLPRPGRSERIGRIEPIGPVGGGGIVRTHGHVRPRTLAPRGSQLGEQLADLGLDEPEAAPLGGEGVLGLAEPGQTVAEPFDGLGLGEQVLGDDQGVDLGVELGDCPRRGRLGGAGRLELADRLVPLLGEIVGQEHDRAERLAVLLVLPEPGQDGQRVGDPLEPAPLGAGRLQPALDLLELLGGPPMGRVVLDPLRARQAPLADQGPGLLQLGQPRVDPRPRPRRLEQRFELPVQVALDLEQVRQPAPRLEQQLPQLARPLEDRLAPGHQLVVIQSEPPAELVLGDPAQQVRQRGVGQRRRAVGGQQRVLRPLAAHERQLAAVPVAQPHPHAHLLVVVQEVVGRLRREPEQRLPQRPQRRRLPRLVRPVDQVQTLPPPGEIQGHVGEGPERLQRELQDLHGSSGQLPVDSCQ